MKRPRVPGPASGPYSDGKIKHAAWQDAQAGIPAWTAPTLPPILWQVFYAMAAGLEGIVEVWHAADQTLYAAWITARRGLTIARQAQSTSEAHLAAAEARHRSARNEPPPASDLRFMWGSVWMLLCALVEVPINEVAFRPMGESEVMTALFTAGLAGSVVVCGDACGRLTKMGKRLGAALCALADVLVIGGVAYLRTIHVQVSAPKMGDVFHFGPFLACYIACNFAVFLAASVTAWHLYDPLLFTVFKLRNTVTRARTLTKRCHDQVNQTYAARKAYNARCVAEANGIVATALRKIEVYKTEVLRYHPDRDNAASPYPRFFDVLPPIAIPAALTRLTWDLPSDLSPDDALPALAQEDVHEHA